MADELTDFDEFLAPGGTGGGDNATARLEELKIALEHFQSNTDVFFLITMGTIVFCKYITIAEARRAWRGIIF